MDLSTPRNRRLAAAGIAITLAALVASVWPGNDGGENSDNVEEDLLAFDELLQFSPEAHDSPDTLFEDDSAGLASVNVEPEPPSAFGGSAVTADYGTETGPQWGPETSPVRPRQTVAVVSRSSTVYSGGTAVATGLTTPVAGAWQTTFQHAGSDARHQTIASHPHFSSGARLTGIILESPTP